MQAPRRLSFEELSLGQSAQFEALVTPAMMDAFRDLSGDANPLHTDPAYARAEGFPDRVVYGMLAASFFSALVGMHLPGERALLQGVELSFRAPIHPGQRLVVRGEVAYLQAALRQVEIKASIRDADGRLLVKAVIKAGLRAEAGQGGNS